MSANSVAYGNDRQPALDRGWIWWLCAVPLFAAAATRGLWAPDEPRRAQVAKELFESGDLLVLRLCGELYPDKPPLLYWLSGLLGWLSGWSEFAMRLVPLGATCLTAWLIGRWARRGMGPLEAGLAPALFLTTVMLTDQGHQLQIDPLLMVCTTAALYTLAHSQSRAAILMAALYTGLAALAKGPVAYVNVGLPLLAWAAFAAWERRGDQAPNPNPAPGQASSRRPPSADQPRKLRVSTVLLAILLAVGPVLAWAVAASLREPAMAEELFWGQHAGRVARGTDHPGALLKSALRMPLLLLPWTALVFMGLAHAWRSRSNPLERELVRAALWLLALLLFFSIIPTKRDLYLLPAYPAAALIGARALTRAAEHARATGRFPRALLASVTLIFGLLLVAGLAAGPVAASYAEELAGIAIGPAGLAWRAALVALPAAIALYWGWRAYRRDDVLGWARAHLLGWSGVALVLALLFFPVLDGVKSSEELGLWLAQRPEAPSQIPCLGLKPEGYRFYGGVPTVAENGDLEAHLDREGDEFLGLIRVKYWDRLDPQQRARMSILREAQVGSKSFHVVGAKRTSSVVPAVYRPEEAQAVEAGSQARNVDPKPEAHNE